MILGVLVALLTIGHAALFSQVKENITSLQRSCINPYANSQHPKDVIYVISMVSLLIVNLISFALVIIIYMYLLNEEKKSTCRNRQMIMVSLGYGFTKIP